MRATITIDLDNAAFEAPGAELARILRHLAALVESAQPEDIGPRFYRSPLTLFAKDANGNRCASLQVRQ